MKALSEMLLDLASRPWLWLVPIGIAAWWYERVPEFGLPNLYHPLW